MVGTVRSDIAVGEKGPTGTLIIFGGCARYVSLARSTLFRIAKLLHSVSVNPHSSIACATENSTELLPRLSPCWNNIPEAILVSECGRLVGVSIVAVVVGIFVTTRGDLFETTIEDCMTTSGGS